MTTPHHPTTHDGATVITDYLIREKVPYVFGLCGHGNIGFLDALHARKDDIKTISVHHESVAGFMADVYYRVSGQPTATITSVTHTSGESRACAARSAPIAAAVTTRKNGGNDCSTATNALHAASSGPRR